MPFQFERSGQRIDAFVKQAHHVIVGAIDHNFAGPHCATRSDLHDWIGCDYPGTAHVPESFPHTLQNARPVVAPLVLIIAADKISRASPVFVFNRVEKILSVTSDLMFWPPEPDEKQPNAKRHGQTERKSSAQRTRHRYTLISFPAKLGDLIRRMRYDFFELGSIGSGTEWSRSQPSFSSLRCSMAIALALASRSGSIWYSETQQR